MHQGGYRKIFPCDNSEKYAEYIKYAENLYKNEKRRKTEPVPTEKPMRPVRKSFVIRKTKQFPTLDIRRKSCASRISFIPKIIQLSMN